MTQTIDAARALDLLRQAVNQDGYGPDYIYPRHEGPAGPCSYALGGAPSCLIGHALHLAGVSVETLSDFDHSSIVPADLVGDARISLTSEAARALSLAQMKQDAGQPWGAALHTASQAVTR